MIVREVMTRKVACCLASDDTMRAARFMKVRNVGIIPIVRDEDHRVLVGVVTDRDLCLEVMAEGLYPRSVQVRQCMTSTVVTCGPEDDVQRAADLMRDNQVRRIPVVDAQGVIQGIVSMGDIVQRSDVGLQHTHETLRKVTEPTEEASKPRGDMLRKSA